MPMSNELKYAIENQTPYYEDGVRFEADVLFDHDRNAIVFLSGDLAAKTASGEPMFIPMKGGLNDTVIDAYKANTGKKVSFIDQSDNYPRPYHQADAEEMERRKGEILSARYFKQHLYTFRGELHD